MKRVSLVSALLSLMIIFSACGSQTQSTEDIHKKIHSLYYSMKSYTADCSITAYSGTIENTYRCDVAYDSKKDRYALVSEDMKVVLDKDKAVITKGENTIETASTPEDLYIFVNTFFKSYYECEDTVVDVVSQKSDKNTLLECSAINPTENAASMKLTIDNKTAKPVKMQVFGKDQKLNTEIVFNKFNFQ